MSSIIPKNFQDIFVNTITPLISTSANISATNITATNLIVTTATIPNIILTGSLNARFNSNTLGNLFTTAGNVGINTTVPGFTLDVNGTLNVSSGSKIVIAGGVDGTSARGIFMNASGDSNWGIYMGTPGTGKSLANASAVAGASFNSYAIRFRVPAVSSQGFIFENSSEQLLSSIRGSDGLTYFAGNVGIATTNPGFTLDVNGTARINTTRGILIGTSADIDQQRMISALNSGLPSGSTSYITLGVAASQNNQAEYAFTYTSTGSVLNCASIGVFGGDVRLNVNRNTVAIGTTTNSTSKLVIYESTGTAPSGIAGSLFIQRGNTGGSSSIVFPAVSNINSDYGFIQFIDSVANAGFTSYNYFGGTGTEVAALLIGCENDSGIGASGPDSVIISPAGNVAITPRNNTTYISGNVGIGTTSPSGPLQIGTTALFSSNGNLTCTGDVLAYGSISDQRLKTNIQTISPETAINTVKQLNPVTFNWRDNVFNKQRQNQFDSGFIAQEVASVLEHATGEYTHIESGTIYKNLKHERIIPYLLRTVQSLLERVELLEKNF